MARKATVPTQPAAERPAAQPKPLCYRCSNEATIRWKIAGTLNNICPQCALARRRDDADTYCQARGITTPEQARELVRQGNDAYKSSNYDAAAKAYDDARKADPKSLEALFNLACAQYRAGRSVKM